MMIFYPQNLAQLEPWSLQRALPTTRATRVSGVGARCPVPLTPPLPTPGPAFFATRILFFHQLVPQTPNCHGNWDAKKYPKTAGSLPKNEDCFGKVQELFKCTQAHAGRRIKKDTNFQELVIESEVPLTRSNMTGWWFGCHFLFSHILGISSSQLTNSYFSEGWVYNHQPDKFLRAQSMGASTLLAPLPHVRGDLQAVVSSVSPCVIVYMITQSHTT